jgi:phospholipid/cholesterol/gamma-HCH transport system substrate-binding protein
MRGKRALEFKVGLFINLGIALLVVALVVLGTETSLLSPRIRYRVIVPNAGGLLKGAKVLLAGVRVGTVDSFDLQTEPPGVVLHLSIPKKYSELVRADSTAEVVTEGVVGDRVIQITPGTPSLPPVRSDGVITFRKTTQLSTVVNKSEELLTNLDKLIRKIDGSITGREIAMTTENINRILKKIDRGSGTLSSIINDPTLYDNAKSLLGEANDNRVLRNIVRKSVEDSEKKRVPAGSQ